MRNKTVASILSLFLGGLGIHKFYLGKIWQGVLYLLFSWTLIPFLVGAIEFIVLIAMTDESFDIKYNSKGNLVSKSTNDKKLIRGKSIVEQKTKKDVAEEKTKTPNKNKKQTCVNCGTEITFMTSPNLGGGFLSDGGRICRKCFSEIVKLDRSFGLQSKKKYDTKALKQLIQKHKERI